jgi:hypothetical protein
VAEAVTPAVRAGMQTTSAWTIEIGDWLLAVKARVPHGLFSALFSDGANSVEAPIPLTLQMGQMFMRIASHPYVREPKHWKHLPIGNVSTLDTMLRATGGGEPADLARLVASGLIHPKMTRTEAHKLRHPRWGPPLTLDPLAPVRQAVARLLREQPTARPMLQAFAEDLLAQLRGALATDPEASTAGTE